MHSIRSLAAGGALALAVLASAAQATPQAALSEDFNNVDTLGAAGWVQANASTPVGSTGWYQGDDSVFSAQAGASSAYIAANYNNGSSGGGIANWLITPELQLFGSGGKVAFWTRTESESALRAAGLDPFADHLTVLFNPTGSTNLADFTDVVAEINAAETAGGFPDDWALFTASINSTALIGRLAFVYTQANADNADYIGIDSVRFASVPEPASFGLTALALGGLLASARRRARKAA